MSVPILRMAIRQRFTSGVSLTLLASAVAISIASLAAQPSRGLDPLRSGPAVIVFTLILGVGIIGQDLRSGVLQLVFARPIRRSSYVLSKWLAVALGSAFVSTVTVVLGALLLSVAGEGVSAIDLMRVCGTCVFSAISLSAVLTFLSSMFLGFGDGGIWIVAMGASQILSGIAASKKWPLVERVAEEATRFLMPMLDLTDPIGTWSLSLFSVTSYASTITLSLVCAIWIMNRRELSYGQT